MDEKEINTGTETTEANTGDGNKPQSTGLVDGANAAAERLEKANQDEKDLLDRRETLMAKERLGGQTDAGAVKEKPKKLTDLEYANAMERGEVNPFREDGLKC